MQKVIKFGHVTRLRVVFPAVDIDQNNQPFTIRREIPDLVVRMSVLLKREVIAAFIKFDKRTGYRPFPDLWQAFDIPCIRF